MDQRKMPDYIKSLKGQRLKLNQAKAALDHLAESVKWVNAHSVDEMVEMELEGVAEAALCSKALLEEALELNARLEDGIRKPPADLVKMLKGRQRLKAAAEEYEEI